MELDFSRSKDCANFEILKNAADPANPPIQAFRKDLQLMQHFK